MTTKNLIQKWIAGLIVFALMTSQTLFAGDVTRPLSSERSPVAVTKLKPKKITASKPTSPAKIQNTTFAEKPSTLSQPSMQVSAARSPLSPFSAGSGGDFIRLRANQFLISGLRPPEEGGESLIAIVDSTGKIKRTLYQNQNPQAKFLPKVSVSPKGTRIAILYHSDPASDLLDKALIYDLTSNRTYKVDLPKVYHLPHQTQTASSIAISDTGTFFILGKGTEQDPASSLQRKLGNFLLTYNLRRELVSTSTILESELGLMDYTRMDLRLNNKQEMLYLYGTTPPEWSQEHTVPFVGIRRFSVKYAWNKKPSLEEQPESRIYGAAGGIEMTPDGTYLIVNNPNTHEQWLIANDQIVFSRRDVQWLDTPPAHQSAASTAQGIFMFTHPLNADGHKNPWLNLYDPKTSQMGYGDFSALLKAHGFQKGSGEFTVTGQTLVNGAGGKQNLVVLASESMPQSSGGVSYRNFLASFPVNTLADFVKKDMHNALLQRIDAQMKSAEEEFSALGLIMKKVNQRIDAVVGPLGIELRAKKDELDFILTELQNLKDDSRLSDPLHSEIASFVDPANLAGQGLDEAALNRSLDQFLADYSMNMRLYKGHDPLKRLVGQIKADYLNALKYRDDLLSYKKQVLEASSLQVLDSLSAAFPVKKQTLFTPIQLSDPTSQLWAAVQKAGTLLNQAQDVLSQENPVQFVNRIASQLTATFVGPDGRLTLQGLREIERAQTKFASNSSLFPDSTQKVFENWSAAHHFIALLKRYLNAPGAGDQLGILSMLWPIRKDSLNSTLKNSVFSILARETLGTSSRAGVGSSGFSNIYNAPLAILLTAVKKENRPEWFPKIRKHAEEKMKRHSLETPDEFERRKAKVLQLFDDDKVIFNYSPQSIPEAPNLREIYWFEGHLGYLDQLSRLIASNPPFMQELDLIEANNALPPGIAALASGAGLTRSFTIRPVTSLVLFLHEAVHIDAAEKGFPGLAPPRISEIFREAGESDFATGYHPNAAEAWAELGAHMASDTVGEVLTNTKKPRLGALAQALNGHLLLLEQVLEYERIYLNQPHSFVTSKLNPQTGEIIYGNLPIKRNAKNQIVELTLNDQTYRLDYDSVTDRLKKVTEWMAPSASAAAAAPRAPSPLSSTANLKPAQQAKPATLGRQAQSFSTIKGAIQDLFGVGLQNVEILVQPINPAAPAGSMPYKIYKIIYAVKLKVVRSPTDAGTHYFYSQPIAFMKDKTWSFNPKEGVQLSKSDATLSQALQGKIALTLRIPFGDLKNISYKRNIFNNVETYVTSYQYKGAKKEMVISRKKETLDWRYWVEDVDELQAPLLRKTDDSISSLQSSIAQMENAVNVFTSRLPGLIAQALASINNKRSEFKNLLKKLNSSKTDPTLSAAIRAKMNLFLQSSNIKSLGVEDSSLTMASKKYLDAMKTSSPVSSDLDSSERPLDQLKADLAQAKPFLKILQTYRQNVLAAKTPFALNEMEKKFPEGPTTKNVKTVDLAGLDPRVKLDSAIKRAKDLLGEGMVATLSAQLVQKVKDATDEVKAKLTKMDHIREVTDSELDLQDAQLRKELNAARANFKTAREEALAYKNQLLSLTGVQGKLVTRLNNILKENFLEQQGWDEPSLDAKTETAIEAARMNQFTPSRLDPFNTLRRNWVQFEKDYTNLQNYLLDLQEFQNQINQSTTWTQLEELDNNFPQEPSLSTRTWMDNPDFRDGMRWYAGKAQMLIEMAHMTQTPVDFVNLVASNLTTSGFDFNQDGSVTTQDVAHLLLATYLTDNAYLSDAIKITDVSSISQTIFFKKDKSWISGFNKALRQAIDSDTPARKLAALADLSARIHNKMIPWNAESALPWMAGQALANIKDCIKSCTTLEKYKSFEIFWDMMGDRPHDVSSVFASSLPSLMQETLHMSLAANDWIGRANYALRNAIAFLKRSNQITESHDAMIADYLQKSIQRVRLETDQELQQRIDIATKTWEKYRILPNYTEYSFPEVKEDIEQRTRIDQHLKFIQQILNLAEGEAPPYIRQFLDVIELNSEIESAGKGYGNPKWGIVIARTTVTVSVIIHEVGHVIGGHFNPEPGRDYPQTDNGLFTTLWEESEQEDFVSGYAETAAHEEWADFVAYWVRDSDDFLTRALKQAVSGKPILLNKFMILDSVFPQDPNKLTTYKVDPDTGKVTKDILTSIERQNGRITSITLDGKTYSLTYASSGRLTSVV